MWASPFSIGKRMQIVLSCLKSEHLKKTSLKNGIGVRTFYKWRKEFIKAAKIHLSNAYINTDDPAINEYRDQLIFEQVSKTKNLQNRNSYLKECIKLVGLFPKKTLYYLADKQFMIERIQKSVLPFHRAAKILGITRNTFLVWKKQNKEGLLKEHYVPNRKADNDFYKEKVFTLMHDPPSKYGLNRTTWSLQLFHEILLKKKVKIGLATIRKILKNAGYKFKHARRVLTSNDPEFDSKIGVLKKTLAKLKKDELFFSVDEYGPFTIKMQGGRSWTPPGIRKTYLAHQNSKGIIILTAALELKTNQVTHFFSKTRNTAEMVKLITILRTKHSTMRRLYLSWDAANWHSSKKLMEEIEKFNQEKKAPKIVLVPLPHLAPYFNLIESVFSGMARAIIHNSNYQSKTECVNAINKYFKERNTFFIKNPKRAGNKIWKLEQTPIEFKESMNCKPHNIFYLNRQKESLRKK